MGQTLSRMLPGLPGSGTGIPIFPGPHTCLDFLNRSVRVFWPKISTWLSEWFKSLAPDSWSWEACQALPMRLGTWLTSGTNGDRTWKWGLMLSVVGAGRLAYPPWREYLWGRKPYFSGILRTTTLEARRFRDPAALMSGEVATKHTLGGYATSLSYRLSKNPLSAFSGEIKSEAWRIFEDYRISTSERLVVRKTDAHAGASNIRVKVLRDVS